MLSALFIILPMKRNPYLVSFAALFVACLHGGSSLARAESLIDLETLTHIDGLFADHSGEDRPGAAIAVLKDGEIAYSKGYGMANLEYRVIEDRKTPSPLQTLARDTPSSCRIGLQNLVADAAAST